MAIFRIEISSLSRGAGRRATAAAAYRAGERIRDERGGQLYNFSRRRDVLHSELFLPAQFEGLALPWARQRERLWNTAEHAEKRHNARVAREYQVLLPAELDPGQRVSLSRGFARELAERYNVAVDLAVHAPRPGSDPRNFHAHLLTTTREVTPAGLGAKAGLDLPPRERQRRGLPDHSQEYVNVRERWAVHVNEALRAADIAARVDHRSLAAQGIGRVPRHVPLVQLKIEQRALRGELVERLRSEYRAHVQQQLDAAPAASAPARDVQEIRRQAREAWLRLRPQATERAAGTAVAHEDTAAASPTSRREDDLAM
ncbi:MAG TPA: MobQ family relaxase [Steroidobacteraceae bacterium]|nr:MobQ family relaxase [Steroidobacteraceae bacterium]